MKIVLIEGIAAKVLIIKRPTKIDLVSVGLWRGKEYTIEYLWIELVINEGLLH